MKSATQSLAPVLSKVEPLQNDSALLSSESVLNILKLIIAGSPLPEVLTIIAQLVESQGKGALCTIWLPDDDGSQLRCAAAPSLPAGFAAHVGPTLVGPKGASCGAAVYRREPVFVHDILNDSLWDDYRELFAPYGIRSVGRDPYSTPKVRSWAPSPSSIVIRVVLRLQTSS